MAVEEPATMALPRPPATTANLDLVFMGAEEGTITAVAQPEVVEDYGH
jgi:hypothetical protein